ncbi:TetR/AcrR family transcriptional regulator [Corynebacterium sp. H78]|uniref:TetR/AcrR family transcriptional regulator n=1 Tax=Corynebacterium sp. H78 TaxID=3133417 RepID=UPI0030AFF704
MEKQHICDCGLRELKRRRTRRGIEDAATELVVKRGYDNVTLDDICAVVGISRRTFFNYFDSKELAVFGPGLLIFTDDDAREFQSVRHDDPLRALLLMIEQNLVNAHRRDDDLPDPIARLEELRRTRRDIVDNEPFLVTKKLSIFGPVLRRVHLSLVASFEAYPDSRQCPELTLSEEASVGAGFLRECILFTATHIEHPFHGAPLQTAAGAINNFARRMSW